MQSSSFPPISREFTKTIAERVFVCCNTAGSRAVRVEVGEPEQDVVVINGMDWRCPVRITIGTESKVRSIVGIDSIQALQLAIEIARVELEIIATQPDTQLLYLDSPIDISAPNWKQGLL